MLIKTDIEEIGTLPFDRRQVDTIGLAPASPYLPINRLDLPREADSIAKGGRLHPRSQ